MQPSTGTIGIVVGSNMIVGDGTLFTQEAAKGKFIMIYGLNQVFQIAQVLDDLTLVIAGTPKGKTGQGLYGLAYIICDHFTPQLGLPMPTPNQINVHVRAINRATIVLDREIPTSS